AMRSAWRSHTGPKMSMGLFPDEERCRSASAKILGTARSYQPRPVRRRPLRLVSSCAAGGAAMSMWTRTLTIAIALETGAFARGAEPPATEPPAAETPAQAPEEVHRGSEYPGAAAFTKLGSAVVVYPAAGAVDAGTAKRSAMARARWLEAQFHMRVEVVGDDRVSDAQQHGNLLVLR